MRQDVIDLRQGFAVVAAWDAASYGSDHCTLTLAGEQGGSGWPQRAVLTPTQARDLARSLLRAAQTCKKGDAR